MREAQDYSDLQRALLARLESDRVLLLPSEEVLRKSEATTDSKQLAIRKRPGDKRGVRLDLAYARAKLHKEE